MDVYGTAVLSLCSWVLSAVPDIALRMSTLARLAVGDERERSLDPALLCGRNVREDSLEVSHRRVKSCIRIVRTRRDRAATPHDH